MKRRGFLTGFVVAGSVIVSGGCLGYTRTSPEEYELIESGFTNGTAWIDVRYNGDTEGKVQYNLYINEGDTRIDTSDATESVELTPGESRRLTAEMGEVIFDREEASVGIKIVNPDPPDSEGNVGMIELT